LSLSFSLSLYAEASANPSFSKLQQQSQPKIWLTLWGCALRRYLKILPHPPRRPQHGATPHRAVFNIDPCWRVQENLTATPRQALEGNLKQKSKRNMPPSCGAAKTATPTQRKKNKKPLKKGQGWRCLFEDYSCVNRFCADGVSHDGV
jgi:hypothetical protein